MINFIMMKTRLGEFLFLLANSVSAFLWMKVSASAYEVGGYLLLFGQVQAAITVCLLPSLFSKKRNYIPHAVLTVMQLFPIICYAVFQGADGGWVSIFSVICLSLGVYVLCTKKTRCRVKSDSIVVAYRSSLIRRVHNDQISQNHVGG